MSLRTIYRDLATLVAQGAPIKGEAGLGFVLKPGFFLPPLMFDSDERDALILGLRLAAQRGDAGLAQAADNALAKIVAVWPPSLEDEVADSGLIASSGRPTSHIDVIRAALRTETKLVLSYRDKQGEGSHRVIWPVALGFFAEAEVLAAWCEWRQDFRHFRLDRIQAVQPSTHALPRRRRRLLAEWRLREGLDHA